LVDDVFQQAGEVATLADDELVEFAPERMTGLDTEVAADIGEDGADRAAANVRGDLLGRG
jgi:hypothetical protein